MSLPLAQLGFAEAYENRLVGPLFRPWAEDIVEALSVAPGDRVLDIACGTGIVARLALNRVGDEGWVVGVDLSPPMLAVAQDVAPGVEWRQGDAGALPVGDNERFDVVVCQQGFQFFPDRPAAAREMYRVLDEGGRLGVSTWRPDDELPVLRELRRIAERHVGPIDDRRHGFGDGEALADTLREAGFRDVRSKIGQHTIHFPDGAVYVQMNAMALVGMSAPGPELSDEDRAGVLAEIVRDSLEVTPKSDGGGLSYELRANVATAIR